MRASMALLFLGLFIGGCLATLDFEGIAGSEGDPALQDASSDAPASAPPSPVSYWPLDDGQGDVAADVIGHRDGTLHPVTYKDATSPPIVTWVDGRRGKALRFPAVDTALVDDYPELLVTAFSQDSKTFPRIGTVTMWFKTTPMTKADDVVFFADATFPDGGIDLSMCFWAASGHMEVGCQSQDTQIPAPDGQWFFAAAAWDLNAGKLAYYGRADGVQRGSYIANRFYETAFVDFGFRHPDGIIDELRFYDRMLTGDQLDHLQE